MNSYAVSGNDSVRLLLMTATPITQNPMELVKLVNLCKPANQQMPSEFGRFTDDYLDEEGRFTANGKDTFLDDIAGHVSYLNREKDARQFAQPIIKHVAVPLVKHIKDVEKYDQRFVRDYLDTTHELKQQVLDESKKLEGELGDLDVNRFNFLKDRCKELNGPAKKACEKAVKANIRDLIKEAKVETTEIKGQIKQMREEIKNKHLFKMDQLKTIKENNIINPVAFERFQTTPYYKIKDKCGYKFKDDHNLIEHLKDHPEMHAFDEDIDEYDHSIVERNHLLKTEIDGYTNQELQLKQSLKAMLKTGLTDLEKSNLRKTAKDEQKKIRGNITRVRREVAADVKVLNKSKKEVEGDRKKSLRETRKNLKVTFKTEKKTEKDLKRADAKLKKVLRKQGDLHEEIEHELLKGLGAKYNGQIDNDVDAAVEAVQAKEDEKQRKADVKKQNKMEKAKAKTEKAKAKTEKAKAKTEKAKEKAHNKTIKEKARK